MNLNMLCFEGTCIQTGIFSVSLFTLSVSSPLVQAEFLVQSEFLHEALDKF